MKIRLVILEKNKEYLTRLVNSINAKYSDDVTIYSFTQNDDAFNKVLNEKRLDIVIANTGFDINEINLPNHCAFAYLVDESGISMFKDHYAICKYQKIDMLYRQILNICSENAGNDAKFNQSDTDGSVIIFASPSGGVGSSTCAAACAIKFAKNRKKTLYLNLEKVGVPERFFMSDGKFGMRDILFALKSKKANIAMKLESCVEKSQEDVYFYAQSPIALDMLDFNKDEIIQLLEELKRTGGYDYIVVDMDFSMNSDMLEIYSHAKAIVLTSDGSEMANAKIHRAYIALSAIEREGEERLLNRMKLLYNRFSSKTGKTLSNISIKDIGGAPRYESATIKEILERLSELEAFDQMI